MTVYEQNPQDERNQALAWAMTALGGALFLLGVTRLIAGFAPDLVPSLQAIRDGSAADPTPVLACLKLAGWFITAGWVVERYGVWRAPFYAWATAAVRRAQALVKPPADGVLEILIGGILFIVLVLGGMVSLWSQTFR